MLMLSVMMLKAVLYQGSLNVSFMIATDREKLVTNDNTTQMNLKKKVKFIDAHNSDMVEFRCSNDVTLLDSS